jgi:PAS domain S-box-containing protein
VSSRPSRGAARLAAILDALPDALLLVNCNGTVVNANAIALEAFEAPGTALVGRGLLDLLPEFDSKRIPGSMRRPEEAAAETRERQRPTRMIARRTDGTEMPVEVTSANLEDGRTPYTSALDSAFDIGIGGSGHYTGDELLMLVVRDLTGTLDTETELARSQRQTEMILRAASEGVIGVDTEGRIVLVNPAAAQILGYRAGDLGGKELHPLLHHSRADGSPLPYEETPLHDTLKSGRKHRVRAAQVLWAKDKRAVPVDMTTAPVRDGEQLVGAVLTFTDRRAYDMLAARHEQLLAVLGDSLRGPLDQMRDELSGLAADPAGQLWPEANQILHHLAAGYARMTTLVDNVLSYQRLDAGGEKLHRELVALDSVVASGVEGAVELIGPGRAQFAVHAPPIEAEVDPARLATALAHLIADVAGVDATGNAPVALAAGVDPTIVVAAARRGDVVRVEVRGPYSGGNPVHVPIVRGIVRRHGGVLQTHEVPGAGGGSAYVLEVPVSAEGAGHGVEDGAGSGSGTGQTDGAGRTDGTGSHDGVGRTDGTGSHDGVGRTGGTGPHDGANAVAGGTSGSGFPHGSGATPRPREAHENGTTVMPVPAQPMRGGGMAAPEPGGEGEERPRPTGRRRGRPSPVEEEAQAAGAPGARGVLELPPAGTDTSAEAAVPVPQQGGGRRARRELSAPEQAQEQEQGQGQGQEQGELGQRIPAQQVPGQEVPGQARPGTGRRARRTPQGTPEQPQLGPAGDSPAHGEGGATGGRRARRLARAQEQGAGPGQEQGQEQGQGQGQGQPSSGLQFAAPPTQPQPARHAPPQQQAQRSPEQAAPPPQLGPFALPPGQSASAAQPPEPEAPGGRSAAGPPAAGQPEGGLPQLPPSPSSPPAPEPVPEQAPPEQAGPGQEPRSGETSVVAASPILGGGPLPQGPGPAHEQGPPRPGTDAETEGGNPRVRTLGQGVPFAQRIAEQTGQQQAQGPAQAQSPSQFQGPGPQSYGQSALPPNAAAQTGIPSTPSTPGQPSAQGRRRKLATPPGGDPQDGTQGGAPPSAQGPMPQQGAQNGQPRTSGNGAGNGSGNARQQPPAAREFTIGAPAAGSAEGPEPLDGPDSPVEMSDGRGLPVPPHAVDDELPPEPLDNPRRLLVWPEPDVSTQHALSNRGYRPVIVHSREEVDAQIAAYPAALFVDPLTGPITRTALQSLRTAAVAAEVPVLVTAGLGQATRDAAYGADPAVLLKALAPRDSEQHPPRVLLVEEHQPIAAALAASLERRGMRIAHAPTDAEAVNVAAQARPNLVVMDLMQVRRRRAGIIDWLRVNGLLNRTPFVVYTSGGIDPDELHRLASGETVLFLAERSTSEEVQSRIVDLLTKIGAS